MVTNSSINTETNTDIAKKSKNLKNMISKRPTKIVRIHIEKGVKDSPMLLPPTFSFQGQKAFTHPMAFRFWDDGTIFFSEDFFLPFILQESPGVPERDETAAGHVPLSTEGAEGQSPTHGRREESQVRGDQQCTLYTLMFTHTSERNTCSGAGKCIVGNMSNIINILVARST